MNPNPRSETIFLTVPFGITELLLSNTTRNASACSRERNTGRTRDRPKAGRPAVVYPARPGPRASEAPSPGARRARRGRIRGRLRGPGAPGSDAGSYQIEPRTPPKL